MKRAQKNFERDPRKKYFLRERNPTLCKSKKSRTEVRDLIIKKKKPGKKKSREIWWNVPKKILSAIREKNFFASETLLLSKSKKSRTEVRDLIKDDQLSRPIGSCKLR